MGDAGLLERLGDHREPGPPVKPSRLQLRRQASLTATTGVGGGQRLLEHRPGYTHPAPAGGHGHTAYPRRVRAEQQPQRADRAPVRVDGEQMQRAVIETVALQRQGHTLLAAEDLLAQGEGGVDISCVAGPAQLGRELPLAYDGSIRKLPEG